MNHGLDTDTRVCFYEQPFYPLSNFSSFAILWSVDGWVTKFDTSEALYHWHKFPENPSIRMAIRLAMSAHEAFKIAEQRASMRRPDWDAVKVDIMRDILQAKVAQHEYVRRKLLETGERELVENSWRDDFWGWGPNRDGKNMLGKLWMEIRAELRGSVKETRKMTCSPACRCLRSGCQRCDRLLERAPNDWDRIAKRHDTDFNRRREDRRDSRQRRLEQMLVEQAQAQREAERVERERRENDPNLN